MSENEPPKADSVPLECTRQFVGLPNGRTLLLELDGDGPHIAEWYDDSPTYICTIEAGGVLVRPNIGDACESVSRLPKPIKTGD